MNPALFYTVLGVGAVVGGYFLYKYIKKKKIDFYDIQLYNASTGEFIWIAIIFM